MKKRTSLGAIATLLLACSLTAAAQDNGYWRAASNTAVSITGDVTLSKNYLTINFVNFPLALVRTLTPAEVAAAFDADASVGREGALYRVNVPGNRLFLHKNTLCGTSDTQWMATYVHGHNLEVAFFSGDTAPILTIDGLSNSTDICGTFTYAR